MYKKNENPSTNMTKICGIAILSRTNTEDVRIIAEAQELSSFNIFQRSSASQFMSFVAKTVCTRTQPGIRQSVQHQDYMCHCFTRKDSLSGVILTDKEYPSRTAFSLIGKLLEDYARSNPLWSQQNQIQTPNTCERFPQLPAWVKKYQDPNEADSLNRVQKELDETKVVLHQTLEGLLNRGEKLDDLVNRSDMLSQSSKAFYTTAKSTNSWCCTLM